MLLLSPARYYLHASKKTGNKYSSPSRFGYHFPFPLLKGEVPKFSRFAKFVRAILKYVDRLTAIHISTVLTQCQLIINHHVDFSPLSLVHPYHIATIL